MLDHLKDKIFQLKRVAGVELHVPAEGPAVYQLVVLQRKQSFINTLVKKSNITSLTELKHLLPDGTPVALLLSGKGILLKKADKGLEREALLNLVLPNARAEDFYISVLEGLSQFVFLARRDRVEEYLKGFDEESIPVIAVHTGAGPVDFVLPYFDKAIDSLSGSQYKLELKNKEVQNVEISLPELSENVEKDIFIGGESIPEKALGAFSSAFQLIAGQYKSTSEELQSRLEFWKEKSIFQLAGKVGLGFFAGILFLNLVLFFYFSSENSELNTRNSHILGDIKRVELLQAELKEKENFLKSEGWINPSRTSFYADRIASTVPKSVLLTCLEINPNNISDGRKEKRMVFDSGRILIKGTCKDPVVLNPWLIELKEQEWVGRVNSRNYQFDHKKKTGIFEIEVVLNQYGG